MHRSPQGLGANVLTADSDFPRKRQQEMFVKEANAIGEGNLERLTMLKSNGEMLEAFCKSIVDF
jgi:hypothetical protein